jgi:hypothetical protein
VPDSSATVFDVDVYACARRVGQVHVRSLVQLKDAPVQEGRVGDLQRWRRSVLHCVRLVEPSQLQEWIDANDDTGFAERVF